MKKLLFFGCLLISLNIQAQKNSNEFKNYFISSDHLTAGRIVKFHQSLSIEEHDNKSYKIKANIGPRDSIDAEIVFKEKISFAGNSYYQYEGQGSISGDKVSFAIESSRDLRGFSKGEGYKEYSNEDLKLFEIHFFYWPYKNKEPLLKNNLLIYPISNVKQNKEDIYFNEDDYKVLNLDYLLKRKKISSDITGTYDDNQGRIRVVELNNNDIIFSLSFGAFGYIEGFSHIENRIITFEENEYGKCKIQISFEKGFVELKSIEGNGGSDCGFGNHIYISNENQRYVKLSDETPNLREDQ